LPRRPLAIAQCKCSVRNGLGTLHFEPPKAVAGGQQIKAIACDQKPLRNPVRTQKS
jgi:hypothetical protein